MARPITSSGPAPPAMSRCASRFACSFSSRYERWAPQPATATASGVRSTWSSNKTGSVSVRMRFLEGDATLSGGVLGCAEQLAQPAVRKVRGGAQEVLERGGDRFGGRLVEQVRAVGDRSVQAVGIAAAGAARAQVEEQIEHHESIHDR